MTRATFKKTISIALNEKTNRIYVANSEDDTVSVIDGTTNLIVDCKYRNNFTNQYV